MVGGGQTCGKERNFSEGTAGSKGMSACHTRKSLRRARMLLTQKDMPQWKELRSSRGEMLLRDVHSWWLIRSTGQRTAFVAVTGPTLHRKSAVGVAWGCLRQEFSVEVTEANECNMEAQDT